MAKNTPSDIPDETGIDTAETDLTLPDLPGGWEWRTANHLASFTGKVDVFFGYKVCSVGGYMGEIDNYSRDGDVYWDVHVRPIVDLGKDGTRPRDEAETCETFDSLDAAIDAVPEHIATHYPAEPEVERNVGDVTLEEDDDGVTFVNGGTAMSVTVPADATDEAADFLGEHAEYYPSEYSEDPNEHTREWLSDTVCVAYFDDGMFAFTNDEEGETVTIPQEHMAVAQGILRDYSRS